MATNKERRWWLFGSPGTESSVGVRERVERRVSGGTRRCLKKIERYPVVALTTNVTA